MRPAAVAYDVGAARDVIEYPINEPGAVQAVRPHRSGAGAAGGPDLLRYPPTGVPAKDEALSTPKIIHFPEKLISRQSRFCISRTASSVGTGITSMESIMVRFSSVISEIMLSLM